jgi:hypothetical protein
MFRKILPTVVTFLLLIIPATTLADSGDGEKVVNIANNYIGVPYKWGGTTPSGFDCSGFMLYIYKKIGLNLPHSSADQYKLGKSVSKSELKPGDLVFFKNTYKPGISHSGIYVGNNQFVSATSSGVKSVSINDPYYWGPKYAGAKRIIKESVPTFAPSPPPDLPQGQYHDVSSKFWAYEEISYLAKQGIINGYKHSMFHPNNEITRAEVAKMISEAFQIQPSSLSYYTDVPSKHWAFTYISAVTKAGFFTGYDGHEFKPNDAITRGEVATLLARAFELQSYDKITKFKDLTQDHWAYEDIQKVAVNNITTGYKDQTYQAKREATRTEFSVFLYRALTK